MDYTPGHAWINGPCSPERICAWCGANETRARRTCMSNPEWETLDRIEVKP